MKPEDFLAGIRQHRAKQARSLRPVRNTVRTNRLDDETWAEVRQSKTVDGKIIGLLTGGGGQYDDFGAAPELVQDAFNLLYKADPSLRSRDEVLPASWEARKIVEAISKMPELEELRADTATDSVMSALALPALTGIAEEILKARRNSPPPPPGKRGGESDEQGEGGQGQGEGEGEDQGQGQGEGEGEDQGQGQGEGEGEGQGQGQSEGQGEGESQGDGDAADQWEQQWDEQFEEDAMEGAISDALNDARSEMENLAKAKQSIGMGKASWMSMPFEERLRLAEELNSPRMKEILAWVGRMTRYALGVRATRVIDVPSEPWTVEVGNDIQRVLQSELALLGDEITKYEFWRKYSQGLLLQYALRGEAPSTGGGIIVCVDISGSMHGDPIAWAIGICEALRRVAKESERDVHIILFNGDIVREFHFPNGDGTSGEILDLLRTAPSGGTNFEAPLRRTLELLEDGRKDDVVFITDGYGYLAPDFLTEFNETRTRDDGFRVFSMYIGTGNSPETLREFSDFIIPIREVTAQEARTIFTHIH